MNIHKEQAVDARVLEALKGVMEDDYGDLIRAYIQDATSKVQRLRDAVANADASGITAITHSLRGTSCNMGALTLAQLSHALEGLSNAQQWDAACIQVTRVEAEFVRVRLVLTAELNLLP